MEDLGQFHGTVASHTLMMASTEFVRKIDVPDRFCVVTG